MTSICWPLSYIDGSKLKAVNNRDRNVTSAKLKRRMDEIESSINRYLTALDTADRQEPTYSEARMLRLEEKFSHAESANERASGD